jgi:hypothetical protein
MVYVGILFRTQSMNGGTFPAIADLFRNLFSLVAWSGGGSVYPMGSALVASRPVSGGRYYDWLVGPFSTHDAGARFETHFLADGGLRSVVNAAPVMTASGHSQTPKPYLCRGA